MSNPSVCAVCLVNGRPEMVHRAILSFEAQTYRSAWLCVYDTSEQSLAFNTPKGARWGVEIAKADGATIGTLRNRANALAHADILCHVDSDDLSHPRRIEEQVALLQASGKECVGYRDMLFWRQSLLDERVLTAHFGAGCAAAITAAAPGEAWLYTGGPNFCLGTSLCYWRSAWEKRPFEDLPKHATGGGEDTQWLRGVDHLGVASVPGPVERHLQEHSEPRMIASIHGGNTSLMVSLAIRCADSMIKRVPAWDLYCRDRMAL